MASDGRSDDELRADLETVPLRDGRADSWLTHGAQLGQYRILSLLGAGGMGVVYRAMDTTLRREVAIKVLPDSLAGSAEQLARFRREAQMLAALNHPNIATLFGLENADGVHYLAMELVPGETLAEQIERGPAPLQSALAICGQVAEALEAAHLKGIAHRDIKPANVKVTPDGRVKVLDFGLAKTPRANAASAETIGPTIEGQIVGTPAYMSPEQVRGQAADHRGDIWAFGCVLFELLSGQRPFRGDTVTDTLAKVLEREPDWKALPPSTPRQIVDLMKRCLRKDCGQRLANIAEARSVIAHVSRRRWRLTRRHLIAAVIVAVTGLGALSVYRIGGGRALPEKSLAILPFENVSGDPATDYLCQGISESLITDLSRVQEVKVVSRNSSFRFAGQNRDPRELGRELGVGRILRGRLHQRAESLSIRAELVDTSNGAILWSEQWERPGSELLQVEQEIARQLRSKLAVGEPPRTAAPPGNTEAFRLYLQGRYYWNTRTEENLRKSAESFQSAINSDPNYSLAWAGLADSFLMLGGWSVLEPKDSYPRARAAAERAIAMDPALAEPHATLGYLKTIYEWDWAGANREFRRAIELQPNYATAHHWYAFYHQTIGDMAGSITEIERAKENDPLSLVINSELSFFYAYARKYERALTEARKIVAVEPDSSYARFQLVHSLALLGRRREAAEELDKIMVRPNPGVVVLGRLAVIYGVLGDRNKAQALLDELLAQSRQRYIYPALIAQTYAVLGDRDRAFEYFDRAVEDRSLVASWLRSPELDGIRGDARYKALFTRLGLRP